MELLLSTILPVVVTAVFGFVTKVLVDWNGREKTKETERQVITALNVGVSKAQNDFVVWAKRSSADGKLSKDERRQAQEIAVKTAIEVASGPASSLLVKMGFDAAVGIVDSIIGKKKTVKNQ